MRSLWGWPHVVVGLQCLEMWVSPLKIQASLESSYRVALDVSSGLDLISSPPGAKAWLLALEESSIAPRDLCSPASLPHLAHLPLRACAVPWTDFQVGLVLSRDLCAWPWARL